MREFGSCQYVVKRLIRLPAERRLPGRLAVVSNLIRGARRRT